VHVATDKKSVITIDSDTCQEENSLELEHNAHSIILTQKYLIASLENNVLYWFEIVQPEEHN
jgi:hypothetical protein